MNDFWIEGFWAPGFWSDGFWAGVAVVAPAPSQGGRAVYMAPYVHMPSPLPVVDSRGDEEVALLHVIS